ncbi:sel1 repeat family protein [Herbaspirillum lusitanum]|uniref:Sel1 repeat family protein n=2 Tax=Herbaspirillum lusitanum TaxID=213312 RepID=A0ABW9AFS2_9BURK
MKIAISLLIFLSISSCQKKENPVANLPDPNLVRANLAFTCIHQADSLPSLDAEADQLFKYAIYLEKKEGSKDFDDIARYYRIAAAHDHYKANGNLQKLISQGNALSLDAPKETLALAARLVDQGIPGGYYDIGHYLELGYGLKQDKEMALRYFRKAADLGSPDAQYYVAELLRPADRDPETAQKMRACAANQSFGKAASKLGIYLSIKRQYPEAVAIFQLGVKGGDVLSALVLEEGFKGPLPADELNYLGLGVDLERSSRYKLIREFAVVNDGRNPKVPDIDQIVPLPPAKLPPWDGTFQWQKVQDAAVPPEKPSDELINRLSREKNLDPATGLPLPGTPGNAHSQKLGSNKDMVVHSGEPCPETGVWCSQRHPEKEKNIRHHFFEGQIMPSVAISHPRSPRWLQHVLGERREVVQVTWKREADDERDA